MLQCVQLVQDGSANSKIWSNQMKQVLENKRGGEIFTMFLRSSTFSDVIFKIFIIIQHSPPNSYGRLLDGFASSSYFKFTSVHSLGNEWQQVTSIPSPWFFWFNNIIVLMDLILHLNFQFTFVHFGGHSWGTRDSKSLLIDNQNLKNTRMYVFPGYAQPLERDDTEVSRSSTRT